MKFNFFQNKKKEKKQDDNKDNIETKKEKVAEPINAPKAQRKYFEVFGDLVRIDNFKTTTIIILLGIIICLLVLVWNLMNRLPIVIRVMPDGGITSFQNAVSYQNTSKPEVVNFTSQFIKFYTAWNIYSYLDDFNAAEKMMTPKMVAAAQSSIQANEVVRKIEDNKMKTVISIKTISVLQDTPSFISIRATGRRVMSSYETQYQKEEGFDIELSILKVERTLDHPYGLLVDNFKEVQY